MRAPLEDSVVLITGASSGIGVELARQLARSARALVLLARREDRLQALARELREAHPHLEVVVKPCDVTDLEGLDRTLESVHAAVGDIDVLVNNAGMGDVSFFEAASLDKVTGMLRVNVVSLTHLTHRLVGGMVQRGRGAILNVSSAFGLLFMPAFAAYAGSKNYVTAFTESLRIELRGTGVVVSQLAPGPVATEFMDVAGNPTDRDIPKFVELSAERCARVAIRQFRRGKALIMPGFWIKALIWSARLTPRVVLRVVFRIFGRWVRNKQLPAK
ncbi:MAG: SDR family oxidoreductase [bacterium]